MRYADTSDQASNADLKKVGDLRETRSAFNLHQTNSFQPMKVMGRNFYAASQTSGK